MITNNNKNEILVKESDFTQSITEFKALVNKLELPITDNIQLLETALRSQLFQKLLAVDKGLNMRFDMLKTDESRIKLITDTINLDGYSEVEEIKTGLTAIEKGYKKIYVGNWLYNTVPFTLFVEKWQMDLDKMLSSLVFDWKEKESVLSYFQSLTPTLTTLREVFRAVTNDSYSLEEMLDVLGSFYTPESSKGAIGADEATVMTFAKHLEEAKAIHLIPQV